MQKTQLLNNIPVITAYVPHMPTTSIVYQAPVGSVYDPSKKYGLSTLARRMMLRGTDKWKNAQKMYSYLEGKGLNAYSVSGRETSITAINGLNRFKKDIVKVLREIIYQPLNNPDDITLEKSLLAQDIVEEQDDPSEYTIDLFLEHVFQNSAYAHSSLGDLEGVKHISRNDIISFQKKIQTAEGAMFIACAGEKNIHKITDLLNEHFGSVRPVPARVSSRKNQKRHDHIRIHQQNSYQPVIALGTKAPSIQSKDYFPFLILWEIMGTGWGSKPVQLIREKMHAAYYAYGAYIGFFNTGVILVYAGVEQNKLTKALAAAKSIFEDMKTGAFSENDMARAKEYYLGKLYRRTSGSLNIAQFFGHQYAARGEILTLPEVRKILLSVNKDQVVELARKFFRKDLYLVINGKVKNSEDDLIQYTKLDGN